ncbi:hypothetical protein K7432_000752 [Basidiobolus ranarum]|uniref:RNA helicase n=1 Tax=Basidiobolus ranarum TaxID=34480 RepID=A0ABR2X438_9FUNG
MESVFTHRTSDVQIDENVTFDTLISNPLLLKGLNQSGYRKPSPIQLKALPLGRLGLDIVAQAKSGTGKTIVFSAISLEAVNLLVNYPQVLILAPTREIAVQIKEVVAAVGAFIEGLHVHVFIGGMPISEDLMRLKSCHIAVGTPGRVQALIQTGAFPAHAIKLFVLDEADKLMEDTFFIQIEAIYKSLPPKKQSMAFSATYDNELLEKINRFVNMPQYIMLCSDTPSLEGVRQFYEIVPSEGNSTVRKFVAYNNKFKRLEELLSKVPFYQCIIFLNHRGRAVELSENLTRKGWPALYTSGGLNQRERLTTLAKARNFQLRVLVCSDLIARGIDIERVDLVVNLDMPRDPETYFHRVGRTGRFGTQGIAVSFIDEDEVPAIQQLQQAYDVKLELLPDQLTEDLADKKSLSKADLKALEKLESVRTSAQLNPITIPDKVDIATVKPSRAKRSEPLPNSRGAHSKVINDSELNELHGVDTSDLAASPMYNQYYEVSAEYNGQFYYQPQHYYPYQSHSQQTSEHYSYPYSHTPYYPNQTHYPYYQYQNTQTNEPSRPPYVPTKPFFPPDLTF